MVFACFMTCKITLMCIIWSLLHILQKRKILIYFILMVIEFFLQCPELFSCKEQNIRNQCILMNKRDLILI